MRIKWYTFLVTGICLLLGISIVRNRYGYKSKSIWWNLRKSFIDTALVVLMAWRLPIVIAGWASVWIARPIKDPMIRVLISAIVGIAFGYLMIYAFEIMIFINIFAVDLVTGSNGFIGRLNQVEEKRIEGLAW